MLAETILGIQFLVAGFGTLVAVALFSVIAIPLIIAGCFGAALIVDDLAFKGQGATTSLQYLQTLHDRLQLG